MSNNRSKERKGQTLGVHLIEVSIKREYTVSLFAIQLFACDAHAFNAKDVVEFCHDMQNGS